MKQTVYAALVLISFSQASFSQTAERSHRFAIDIDAPIDTVWSRWTSVSGMTKFFAAAANIELTTLGRLDVLFLPSSPEGQRGAENNRILAVQEKQMISFTWDAPPTFPEIRKQRTIVIVRFFNREPGKTTVTLTQTGFGSGPDWDAVYNYFEPAWRGFVLPNLKYSCEVAPINFKDFPANVPKNLPLARKL
jgi:uncharacterized protein YndB with AHSA1/START domain